MPQRYNLIENCLERALQFIFFHQNDFSIQQVIEPEDKLIKLKPFAELVLTINILKKYGISNYIIDETKNWLWAEIKQGDELLDLLMARNDLIVLACIYADFLELGYENKELHKFINYLSKISPINNIENPFWRKLDIQYSLSRLKIIPFPSSPLKEAWINGFLPPWTISTDLAYAITHEVFYVTDFGFNKERMDLDIKLFLRKWLVSWIRIFVGQNNWDLAAEFLMVAECIDFIDGIDDYFLLLVKQQHENGFIPSPPNSGLALFKETDSIGEREFLTNYHTTLVSIMAIVMRLARK